MVDSQLNSAHVFDPFDGADFFDEGLEFGNVFELNDDGSVEEAVVRIDVDGAHHDFFFFRDDARDVVDDAQVVVAHHFEGEAVLTGVFAAPAGLDDAVAESAAQFGGIGAVVAVDFDAAAHGDEAEDGVAVDGLAAFGQGEVQAFEVAVDDEHVVFAAGRFFVGMVEAIFGGTARGGGVEIEVVVAHLDVGLDHLAHVELPVGKLFVEVGGQFEAHPLDEVHHGALVEIDLAVLHPPLEQFAGVETVFDESVFERELDLGFGARGFDDVHPVGLRSLIVLGEDFHLVARFEFGSQRYVSPVDASAYASIAHAGVDAVGEVENGGSFGEFEQFALGGEDEHFVFVEAHFELIHELQVVVALEGGADVGEPLVDAALTLDALVSPVGSEPFFGDFVHPLGANLHFYPLFLRAQDGDVQTFVAVALGHAEPVAQTFGIGHVHVCHDGVGLPALHLLLLYGRIDDDANGKEVVDALETTFLFLHLLPNGVDALRPAFHVEMQTGLLEALLDGGDESLDVAVAGSLGGVELFFDEIVGVVLEIFKTEVFEFALQLVEPQFMSQRRIQITGLLGHLLSGLLVERVAHLTHQVHPVGNHEENHAHVFSKRNEQIAEVFALDHRIALVKLLNASQSVDDLCHARPEFLLDVFLRRVARHDARVKHYGDDGIPTYANLLDGNLSCLQSVEDGVQSESVALQTTGVDRGREMPAQFVTIVGQESVGIVLQQSIQNLLCLLLLCLRKNEFLFHVQSF